MSDARSIADMRLAKGEITPDEHAAIIASLTPSGNVPPQPVAEKAGGIAGGGPVSFWTKLGAIMCPIGAVMMFSGRDEKLSVCRAAAETQAALNECGAQYGGSAILGIVFALLGLLGAVVWAIQHQAQQKK